MNKDWKPNWHNATEELPPREENGSGDVSICVLVTDGKEKMVAVYDYIFNKWSPGFTNSDFKVTHWFDFWNNDDLELP